MSFCVLSHMLCIAELLNVRFERKNAKCPLEIVSKRGHLLVSCVHSCTAVSKAYEMFGDEEKYAYCKGVVEEAQATVDHKLEEKRALAKKAGRTTIEEDDPEKVVILLSTQGMLCVTHSY